MIQKGTDMPRQPVSLASLLCGVSYLSSASKETLCAMTVTDVISDSRKAKEGVLFVCTVGELHDSHRYANEVYQKGCRAFVVQYTLDLPEDALQIKVENARAALAKIAHNYFDHPADKLHIIGITGTKGKTTIANLTANVLNLLGIKTGCIGTNGVSFDGVTRYTGYTTPEAYELARVFDELYQKGAQCVVMEVSSLGVKQHRTDGLTFDVGVFTNLSPDHIGDREHPTMEDYVQSKARMFAQCKYAVINADDGYAGYMTDAAHKAKNQVYTYALHAAADFTAKELTPWQTANRFGVGFCSNVLGAEREFAVSQPGDFSVYNALAVLAVCKFVLTERAEAICSDRIAAALQSAVVAGRIELVDALSDATVIIDYAHNELSMESLLATLQRYRYERLVVVFGSVGCRSQIRRHPLGEVAAKYADFCILTSDNPDTEDPMSIISDIAAAFEGSDTPYLCIPDREQAVEYAITNHKPGDMIVFAGKGHEDYQLIDGKRVPFCEKEIILRTAKAQIYA